MEAAQNIVIECKANQIRPLIDVKDERPVDEILADANEGDSLWPVEKIAGDCSGLDDDNEIASCLHAMLCEGRGSLAPNTA
eukprot:2550109-Rhodomonas_salina.1